MTAVAVAEGGEEEEEGRREGKKMIPLSHFCSFVEREERRGKKTIDPSLFLFVLLDHLFSFLLTAAR